MSRLGVVVRCTRGSALEQEADIEKAPDQTMLFVRVRPGADFSIGWEKFWKAGLAFGIQLMVRPSQLAFRALIIIFLCWPFPAFCDDSPDERALIRRCKALAISNAIDRTCAVFLAKQEMRARKLNFANYSKFEASFSPKTGLWVVVAESKESTVDSDKFVFV